jgi:hypothetical protein
MKVLKYYFKIINMKVEILLLLKKTVFVADKSVINTNPIDFDLLNHEFYLLYCERGEEEIPIGIIKTKLILNSNNNIYKFNIIFIFEDLIIKYGLFSPYKQLQRMDYMEQYYWFTNRNIQFVPPPLQNVNVNNYMLLLSPMSILPNSIQTQNIHFSSNNSNINYPINNTSYYNSNFINNNNVINNYNIRRNSSPNSNF